MWTSSLTDAKSILILITRQVCLSKSDFISLIGWLIVTGGPMRSARNTVDLRVIPRTMVIRTEIALFLVTRNRSIFSKLSSCQHPRVYSIIKIRRCMMDGFTALHGSFFFSLSLKHTPNAKSTDNMSRSLILLHPWVSPEEKLNDKRPVRD